VGVVLAAAGLVALVSGCAAAASLRSPVALLALFIAHEARTAAPLLPLHIVIDRNRGGACATAALAIVGMMGLFLLLTYYFQVVLGYPPLRAGVAFLPMTAASLVGSTVIASRVLPRVAPRLLMTPGLVVAALGMALLTRIRVDSTYLSEILPAELLVGLGVGCVMVPAFSVATQGVDPRETGVASALVNTAQQVGGSIGAALLNAVATSTTADYVAAGGSSRMAGLVRGYSAAAACAAIAFVVAAALAVLLITAGRPTAGRSGDRMP
jgi:hypothetical protein